MVEHIIELGIELEAEFFGNLESLSYVEVGPPEPRRSELITSCVSILAVLHIRSRKTSAGSTVDNRLECIGVQPLDGARLCDSRNRSLGIGTLSRNRVCKKPRTAIDEFYAGSAAKN